MSKYPGRIVTDLAPAGYSVFFTGTSYLSVPAGSAFAPGTGNFTIEAWVYPTSSGDRFIWTQTVSGTNYFVFQITTTTAGLTMTASGGGTFISGPANSLVQNAWNHVAAVRSSGTVTVYVNGVGGTPTSNTLDLSNTTYTPVIGTYTHSPTTNVFAGYMSNLRYVKGTALYTANFAPPTQLFNVTNTSFLSFNSPAIVDQGTANSGSGFPITVNGLSTVSTLTPFTAYVPYNPALGASTPGVWTVDEAMQAAATRQWNMYDPYFNLTTLLLHGNSPSNVPTLITDASSGNVAITSSGSPVASSQSPFSLTSFPTSGSGYFPTTSDFFNASLGAGQAFGTGDFTVECWLYTGVSACNIMQPSASTNTWGFLTFSNQLYWQFNGGNIFNAGTVPSNTWTHLAVSRTSSSTSGYVNGTRVFGGTASNDTNNYSGTPTRYIGPSGGGSIPFFVSNARVVKGTGLYSGATITVPTSPLTAVTNTALLTLQNSQSANNNAFLDSSSNNFLITRNGNTTQGSYSPFSQTGWSNFFVASASSTIGFANNAAFQFGAPSGNANDFVVEFFVYPTTTAISAPVHTGYTSGTTYWGFGLNRTSGGANTAGQVQFFLTDSFSLQATTGLVANQQNHICAVRTGTTVSLFVNGIRQATGTSSVNPNPTGLLYVGGEALSLGRYLDGYVSNLRIIKGATLPYDANSLSITVPITQLTTITGTTVLTCQSNRFADASSSALPVPTISGTPSVQAFSPFLPTVAYTPQTIGGSGYFDGTTDWLSIADNAAFDFGSGDFTIELWAYMTGAAQQFFVSQWNTPQRAWAFLVKNSGATLSFVYSTTGSNEVQVDGSIAAQTNRWAHFAAVRNGNTIKTYMNGVEIGSGSVTGVTIFNASQAVEIGRNPEATTQWNLTGYASSLRIVKGTAVYTGAFTPPIAPVTTSGPASSYSSTTNVNTTFTSTNTALLTNFTNAGITDATAKNDLETVGNAQISTTQSKFGGSSMYFDGTGDYLYLPSNRNLELGTGDFTLECWVYATSAPSDVGIFESRTDGNGATTNGFTITAFSSSVIRIFSGSVLISSSGTSYVNTWCHVAVTRVSGTFNLYINGVSQGTSTTARTLSNTDAVVGGGRYGTTGAVTTSFPGYIDDFRITKGFARYTANFTPQTSQWQDQ